MNRFSQRSVEVLTNTELHRSNNKLKADIERLTPLYRQAKAALESLDTALGIRISRQQDIVAEIYKREGKVTRVTRSGKTTYTLAERVERMTEEEKATMRKLLRVG